jgi:hypothetical protein
VAVSVVGADQPLSFHRAAAYAFALESGIDCGMLVYAMVGEGCGSASRVIPDFGFVLGAAFIDVLDRYPGILYADSNWRSYFLALEFIGATQYGTDTLAIGASTFDLGGGYVWGTEKNRRETSEFTVMSSKSLMVEKRIVP